MSNVIRNNSFYPAAFDKPLIDNLLIDIEYWLEGEDSDTDEALRSKKIQISYEKALVALKRIIDLGAEDKLIQDGFLRIFDKAIAHCNFLEALKIASFAIDRMNINSSMREFLDVRLSELDCAVKMEIKYPSSLENKNISDGSNLISGYLNEAIEKFKKQSIDIQPLCISSVCYYYNRFTFVTWPLVNKCIESMKEKGISRYLSAKQLEVFLKIAIRESLKSGQVFSTCLDIISILKRDNSRDYHVLEMINEILVEKKFDFVSINNLNSMIAFDENDVLPRDIMLSVAEKFLQFLETDTHLESQRKNQSLEAIIRCFSLISPKTQRSDELLLKLLDVFSYNEEIYRKAAEWFRPEAEERKICLNQVIKGYVLRGEREKALELCQRTFENCSLDEFYNIFIDDKRETPSTVRSSGSPSNISNQSS